MVIKMLQAAKLEAMFVAKLALDKWLINNSVSSSTYCFGQIERAHAMLLMQIQYLRN